jgi:transcriptional regulator with GAF, ATPase, and Fis domain
MSPILQSKLLRVLQEREFEPLGSERSQQVDVRVIAATNRDLRQMVSDGTFQEDLFYRLNVIPIEILHCGTAGRCSGAHRALRPEASAAHGQAHRPARGRRDRKAAGLRLAGNVRELENTIERAVVLATSG